MCFLDCYCSYLATLEATTENRGALTQKRTAEIHIFFSSQKSPLKNLAKFLQRAGKFKCEERDQLSELHIQLMPLWLCFFTLGQKTTVYLEIPLNLMFQKCEFCEYWDFRNVNFVKIEISEMWILWILRFQICEFCKNCDFQYVNFWIKCGFLPQRGVFRSLFVSCETANK